MNVKQSTGRDIDTPTAPRSTQRGRRLRVAGVITAAGLLGLSACASDPGPRRVAEDIIKSEALANPALDEECLLNVLKNFSNDDLKQIADDLGSENSDRNASGEAALKAYELQLSACK